MKFMGWSDRDYRTARASTIAAAYALMAEQMTDGDTDDRIEMG